MNRYALISGGRVQNVIMSERETLGDILGYDAIVESDTAGPGWGWTAETGFAPPESPPTTQAAVLSRLEFIRRFTPAERQAIRQARSSSTDLDDFMYLLEMAETVRTNNADVIAGLAMLEAGGLLATGRAAEILAG